MLRADIGLAKYAFRDKVKRHYQHMNTRDAYINLKVMAGDVNANDS